MSTSTNKRKRWYRIKNPVMNFFCALCGADRQLPLSRRPTVKNYLQMLVVIFSVWVLCYPWLQYKGIVFAPMIWLIWELIHYSLFRRKLPCPHCGFDAAWYVKDVKVAKKKVRKFWEQTGF